MAFFKYIGTGGSRTYPSLDLTVVFGDVVDFTTLNGGVTPDSLWQSDPGPATKAPDNTPLTPPAGPPIATGGSLPAWSATTLYSKDQAALDPSGNLIVRIAKGTSRSTYDATEQATWMTSTASQLGPSVPLWTTGKSYTAGQVVMHPTTSGLAIQRITSGVARNSFDATEQALWLTLFSATYVPQSDVGYGAAKTGAFSLGTTAASQTTTISEWHQRDAVRLPRTSIQWRLHVRNYDYRSGGAATAGAITVAGVYVGLAAKNADGTFTAANFTAAPALAVAGFTTDGAGAEYVSPWVTDPTMQFAAQRDYLIAIGGTCAGGQTLQRVQGTQSWFSSGAGATANLASQNATLGSVAVGIMDVWIEYQFAGVAPVGVFIGDSLTEGNSATYGQRDNYPNQWAQRSRGVAVVNAANGSSTTHWTPSSDPKWTKFTNVTPDFVVVMIGTNDLNSGTSVATIQTNIGSIVANARATWGASVAVYLGTIPPRGYALSAYNDNRIALNKWLRTLPFGVQGCLSFDKNVQDAPARYVVDGATTSGSSTVPSATAAYQATDVGRLIQGAGIPYPSFVGVVNSGTSAGLSSTQGTNTPVNATASATGVTLTIGGPALDPEWAITDATHMTTGGYARMADAVPTRIASVA